MATTKQAERTHVDALIADEYLTDLVYDALLERGEAAKVSEITLEIDNPRITFPVIRRAVSDSPRFITIDRLWDVAARYLDRGRPTERTLGEVLNAAGKPLSTAQMATELSIIYARGSEVYSSLLSKLLKNGVTYFKATDSLYGLTAWLPLVDADNEADLLADNEISAAALQPYRKASLSAKWSPARYADATFAIVDAAGTRPLPHRLLGVLAWLTLQEKYDPVKHFQICFGDSRLVWLSGRGGGRWITRVYADTLEGLIEERGHAMAGEDQEEPSAPPPAPPIEAPVETPDAAVAPVEEAPAPPVIAEAPPLQVNADDLASLARIVAERGAPIDVVDLLSLQYEVVPGDRSFRVDVEILERTLKESDQFLYVGSGRFREPNSLPLFVYDLPEYLTFPDLQFVSLDGEIMDEEIEDEGLAGTLRMDLFNPLVQDAGDDEGAYTGPELEDPQRIRLVVKTHHKEIGTFPLAQIPDGFFPRDAPVVEIVIRDTNGEAHNIIVNNEIRLAFNFFGLYELLPADSGAVFTLQATARPYEFRFEPVEEDDPQVSIPAARMGELLSLREQAEDSGDLATFDIACEILAHYTKGIDFVQLFTEINIVRRVRRRKVASILSNYFCFMQKVGQNLWRFDAKKRDLGTDRTKRKYIKR